MMLKITDNGTMVAVCWGPWMCLGSAETRAKALKNAYYEVAKLKDEILMEMAKEAMTVQERIVCDTKMSTKPAKRLSKTR